MLRAHSALFISFAVYKHDVLAKMPGRQHIVWRILLLPPNFRMKIVAPHLFYRLLVIFRIKAANLILIHEACRHHSIMKHMWWCWQLGIPRTAVLEPLLVVYHE